MKIFCLLLCLLLSHFSLAEANSQNWRDEILTLVPTELKNLDSNDSAIDLKKRFSSKITKSDKDGIYLKYFSEANDVTIGLKNDKFKYVYIDSIKEFRKRSNSLFKRIYQNLTPAQKKALGSKSKSHDDGRYISIDLPQEGLKLIFLNNETYDLKSVIIWPVGGAHP